MEKGIQKILDDINGISPQVMFLSTFFIHLVCFEVCIPISIIFVDIDIYIGRIIARLRF